MKNNTHNNLDIYVSVFIRKESRYPAKNMNLWEWLLVKHEYAPLVKEIRETDDEKEQKNLKAQLPAVTPSGIFSQRRAECLEKSSNLICIDIDGKDNPSISNMEELKERLGKLPYIMYCGLSASGKGVFCIILYEDHRKHELYFYALEQEFKDMGIVVDSSCSDICRLRFYSYDEYPYVNFDAEVYTRTLDKSSAIHLKSEIIALNKSGDRRILNVTSKSLSLREALLQPSNLDFASAVPLSKTEETERLLNLVVERRIDITSIYNDWIKIGLVIRNLFGDKGVDLFDKVSSFHPKYSQEEVEDKFFKLDEEKYRASTQSLFEIAAKYGIYK